MIWFLLLGSAISALFLFLDIYFVEGKFRTIDIPPTLFMILTSWLGAMVIFVILIFDIFYKHDKIIWARKKEDFYETDCD